MRIVVFGSTGHTGGAVVEQAVRRGHSVTAASRRATSHSWPSGVEAAAIDVTDSDAVREVLRSVDAAVFAVGVGAQRRPTATYSAGIANVLAGLDERDDGRVSAISAVPVAPRDTLPLGHRVLVPLLSLFFGSTYADMHRMEQLLRASRRDWTCLRPPRLVAGPARGSYRLGTEPTGYSITHADLATALIDALAAPEMARRTLFVAA